MHLPVLCATAEAAITTGNILGVSSTTVMKPILAGRAPHKLQFALVLHDQGENSAFHTPLHLLYSIQWVGARLAKIDRLLTCCYILDDDTSDIKGFRPVMPQKCKDAILNAHQISKSIC